MKKFIQKGDHVAHRYRLSTGRVTGFTAGDRWVLVELPNSGARVRWLYDHCEKIATAPAVVPPLPEPDTYVAKRDQGKPRFDLLHHGVPDALLGLVDVLTWAVEVKGYKEHSWRTVPDAIKRYEAARARHENAIDRGETHDPESGLLHDLHVLACQVFISQLRIEANRNAT